jgi:hypothetical protein
MRKTTKFVVPPGLGILSALSGCKDFAPDGAKDAVAIQD